MDKITEEVNKCVEKLSFLVNALNADPHCAEIKSQIDALSSSFLALKGEVNVCICNLENNRERNALFDALRKVEKSLDTIKSILHSDEKPTVEKQTISDSSGTKELITVVSKEIDAMEINSKDEAFLKTVSQKRKWHLQKLKQLEKLLKESHFSKEKLDLICSKLLNLKGKMPALSKNFPAEFLNDRFYAGVLKEGNGEDDKEAENSLKTPKGVYQLPRKNDFGVKFNGDYITAKLNRSLKYLDQMPLGERNSQPKNPCKTPSFFPQTCSHERTIESFSSLDFETLFFIFYFQQGNYEQYLAAKVLKKASWRFHKYYQTWFQRRTEPEIINDTYEKGSYVYFDYGDTWGYRNKDNFVFEYKYLEDELD